jgi:putative glycerol-1-phosphate prenyltransferase
MNIYTELLKKKKKGFAVLIDPDKYSTEEVGSAAKLAQESGVDYIFIGGSLLTSGHLEACIKKIKSNCSIPVIIFPGSVMQVNENADGILLLSLISGRNADLLIGKQVIAAPIIKRSGLEVLPTGYMLIESGNSTTALYMSNTSPIPRQKNDIAVCTALAGEMLGLKLLYMDAGSGAKQPVPDSMIADVKSQISIPLIVGGGIRDSQQALDALSAGADIIVVGNAIEENNGLIREIGEAIRTR